MYKKHIINKAMKILFLAMLTSQLHASCAYAEEKTSTDQNIGIEADLIAEDTELVEVPVLLKERATADDTVPAAEDAESESAEGQASAEVIETTVGDVEFVEEADPAEAKPTPAAEDAESESVEEQAPAEVPETTAEDAESVEEADPAEAKPAPAAKDAESDSAEEQAPAAVPEIVAEDAESDSSEDQIPAAVPELAAEDTKAALSVEDQIPNIDDLGPAGEDTSQSTKNVSDSQEAPEFSCLDDLLPHNGIPLVIIRINEDGDNSTIYDMNESRDHSVKCIGTVEIRFPDGYSIGDVSLDTTTEEMLLEYIRGRGNSTWGAPKKPYKIKFDSKQDLVDMGKSKEWALLANSLDPTVMKNRITYELGEMMGLGETPQIVPVEVVMIGSQNGSEYLGLYDLSETIKFEKSRLDLKTPDEDATQEEGDRNITGAYLVSLFNWSQDSDDPSSNHFTTDAVNNVFGFMFREPEFESEDLTEAQKAQREYMQTYIRDLEVLIMTDDYIDEEQHQLIADKMDLTSTADYWWVQIFSKNTDSYATSSTYMYKPADDKLYWGPLWDFDMGFAFDVNEEELDPTSAEGYYTIGFPWIDHLRESDPYFVKLLKDRWGELQPKLEALTADGGIIDQFKTEIAGAQADDYRKWSYAAGYNPYYKGVSDYDAVIDRLKQLIDARVIWFSENLETVGSFLTVSMDAAGGTGVMADIITVKKDGEFELPVCEFTPENGSEFVGWKIGDKLYGEGDVVTLSKDTVIMAVWKVTAPDDEPVDEPTEIVTPVPDKPAAVEFVAYETKPDKKTEDDPSDTVANAGRSEERKAEVTAGNGKYRSPDSGDEPETLLWLLILVVAGIAGGLRAVSIMKPNPGAVTPLGLR